MSQYTVRSGQNLYDIALTLHGSIEGLIDLLVSNPGISLNDKLKSGDTLEYDSVFDVNTDISEWFSKNNRIIKNGYHGLDNLDVRQTIVDWLTDSNASVSSKFPTIQSLTDADISAFLPNLEDDFMSRPHGFHESVVPIASGLQASSKNWGRDNITTSYDFSTILPWWKTLHTNNDKAYTLLLFSEGAIILPTDNLDLQQYYEDVFTPKLIIQQIGRSSQINAQIAPNCFIAIDWGDGSGLNFFHYERATLEISHVYEDEGEHLIRLYGNCKFLNLDFSEINGVYYALRTIRIKNQFITPFPESNILNKLFIIKNDE